MHILLGVDDADTPADIDAYVRAGAQEFYAGIVPPAWYERYGWEVSPNRRQSPAAQFRVPDFAV